MLKRNKKLLFNRMICFLLALVVTVSYPGVLVLAKSNGYTAGDLSKVIDGVLAYKQNQAQVDSVQDFIDTTLAESAGNMSADWFAIALYRYQDTYDYANYLSALDSYADEKNNTKATDFQRMALAYSAVGNNDTFIQNTVESSIGKLGIMSYVYGLILLDVRDYSSENYTREEILDEIIKLQLSDGGWALYGEVSDIDVTAMALQALAPYEQKKAVKAAVNRGLTLLSKRQENTGDYKSWGTRCCESTAQVITALTALDIDLQTDKRFIKNKKTLLDGLLLYQQSDGGFSHLIAGKSDNTASVQALYSLISLWRQTKGLSTFYNFSGTDKLDNMAREEKASNNNSDAKDASDQSGATASEQSGASATGQNSASKSEPSAAGKNAGGSIGSVATEQSGNSNSSTSSNENGTASGQTGNSTGTTENSAGNLSKDVQSGEAEGENAENNFGQSEQAGEGQDTQAGDLNTSPETENSNSTVTMAAVDDSGSTLSSDNTGDKASAASDKSQTGHKASLDYRAVLTIISAFAALLAFVFLHVTGRRSRRNYLTVLIVTGIALIAVWGIKLQSVEDYYRTNPGELQRDSETVLLSIRCDTVAGQEEGIPEDGIILDQTEYPIEEGDSVLDVLILAAKQNKLPLDYEGGDTALGSAYVSGINDLYEMDFGSQSGWLYSVNGDYPGVSCGDYLVKAEDVIEWVYTCDLGKDVGRE